MRVDAMGIVPDSPGTSPSVVPTQLDERDDPAGNDQHPESGTYQDHSPSGVPAGAVLPLGC